MPPEMIDYGAKALKPVENYIVNYLKLWDNLDNPQVVESWHAMNTWVSDNIPMTGGAFRQLIVDLYRNDRLMKGELMIRGERVDLSRLRANLLTVIAEGDHITPPCQSESVLAKVGSSDKEAYRVRGGHIGIMAGSGAKNPPGRTSSIGSHPAPINPWLAALQSPAASYLSSSNRRLS